MIKQVDIINATGFFGSNISRILKGERRITYSMAISIKEMLGGQLEDYLFKQGKDAESIFQEIVRVHDKVA